jgi:predicted TIM-barrel fold metal-dependent hydrolase
MGPVPASGWVIVEPEGTPKMIVDCHTHIWERSGQLGALSLGASGAGRGGEKQNVDCPDFREYRAGGVAADVTIVLGFKSRYLGADIPNRAVADFVSEEPQKFIGFAGIDPTDRYAEEEIDRAVDLGLRGVTLSPAAQDVHPSDPRMMRVCEAACDAGLPVVFHQGGHFAARSKMEYARPYLLDEVARTFPELRIVISHLGYPWVEEAVVLLEKHPHVYADVCTLPGRPWQAYQALSLCHNAGVMGKLLFGSDFPYATVEGSIKALYSLNELTQGTNMPTVPLREIRGIVERDALRLLGLSKAEPARVVAAVGSAPVVAGRNGHASAPGTGMFAAY